MNKKTVIEVPKSHIEILETALDLRPGDLERAFQSMDPVWEIRKLIRPLEGRKELDLSDLKKTISELHKEFNSSPRWGVS